MLPKYSLIVVAGMHTTIRNFPLFIQVEITITAQSKAYLQNKTSLANDTWTWTGIHVKAMLFEKISVPHFI